MYIIITVTFSKKSAWAILKRTDGIDNRYLEPNLTSLQAVLRVQPASEKYPYFSKPFQRNKTLFKNLEINYVISVFKPVSKSCPGNTTVLDASVTDTYYFILKFKPIKFCS